MNYYIFSSVKDKQLAIRSSNDKYDELTTFNFIIPKNGHINRKSMLTTIKDNKSEDPDATAPSSSLFSDVSFVRIIFTG